jgi:hypothetical protein
MADRHEDELELEQRLARLRERAAAPPARTWRKEEEPELAGYMVERGPRELADGQRCDVVILADARTGEHRAVWLWHEVLRGRFDELRPARGELVLVQYAGKAPSQADPTRSYHRYVVVVDRDEPPVSRPSSSSPAPASSSRPPDVEEPPWPTDEPEPNGDQDFWPAADEDIPF